MPTTRLKRYWHFPALPDTQALVALLRLAAIYFETRYVRGANYDRARHEPDRLEVWIRATDYARVRQLEAALTREQALALADNTLPADQLRRLIAAAFAPPAATVAAAGKSTRKPRGPSAPTNAATGTTAPSLSKATQRWLVGMLFAAGLAALAYAWLK
jgi:hypothetical protein